MNRVTSIDARMLERFEQGYAARPELNVMSNAVSRTALPDAGFVPAAAANIGNRFELLLGRGFPHERHNGSRIQNMAFPNNRNVSWSDQATGFAFFDKFRMKNTQLAQRIPQHFLKNRRIIKFVCHITHGHHPISCSSLLPVFQPLLPDQCRQYRMACV